MSQGLFAHRAQGPSWFVKTLLMETMSTIGYKKFRLRLNSIRATVTLKIVNTRY